MGKPRDLANVVATGNILADGAVAPAELTGVTSTAAEINILDGVTATAAELNLLDGVTATTAELNYVDGVTSNVQTQMDTKAPVASPTFTGTATAPTVNASTALQIGGTAITATATELNKMDGVTVSASDINSVTTKAPIDGATFTGTTTIPTADINGGAIDGAIIGANSAAAVTATTVNASTKLQVNGTDVITNARALSNITSIDATTAAAIGAGGVGGGGSIELTASGAITAGDLVGVIPSGSVSKLKAKSKKNTVELNVGNQTYRDSKYIGNNKIVVCYLQDSSTLIAKVGTISGNTISFGSECDVNTDGGTGGAAYNGVAYDPNTGNVVFVWTDGSASDTAHLRAGSISGTTITLGDSVQLASGAAIFSTSIEFDPDAQRGIVCYKEGNAFQYSLFSLGGTGNRTITLVEDSVAISGNPRSDGAKLAYDTTADKMIIMFRDAATGFLHHVCADIGSTSVTFGTRVVSDSAGGASSDFNFDIAFIPTLNKVGYVYKNPNNVLITGLITLSGTTITKNETTLLDHGNVNDYSNVSMAADSDGKCLIVYGDTDSSNTDKVRAIIGSFSGTSFVSSLSDFTLIMEDSTGNQVRAGYFRFYYTDSTNDNHVLVCFVTISDSSNATNGVVAYSIPNTDDIIGYDNWIGIASQSVSDGASVDVTVQGGLNENQSSLDVGRKYYLQDDGTITTTFKDDRLIGISTAATKLFLTNGSIVIGPTGFNSN